MRVQLAITGQCTHPTLTADKEGDGLGIAFLIISETCSTLFTVGRRKQYGCFLGHNHVYFPRDFHFFPSAARVTDARIKNAKPLKARPKSADKKTESLSCSTASSGRLLANCASGK
jgi:hypothetical protein